MPGDGARFSQVALLREKKHAADYDCNTEQLCNREKGLDTAAECDAYAVDGGKEKNGRYGHNLDQAELPLDLASEYLKGMICPNAVEWKDGRKKCCESHPQNSDRTRSGNREAGPAKQEGWSLAVGRAQVNIFSAGFRQSCPQFRVGQRPCQRQQAGRYPGRQNKGRGFNLLHHDGSLHEHTRTDYRANHEHRGVGKAKSTDRLVR